MTSPKLTSPIINIQQFVILTKADRSTQAEQRAVLTLKITEQLNTNMISGNASELQSPPM